MVFYAQTGRCRWRVMLDYFAEPLSGERRGPILDPRSAAPPANG
jgi:hypothetical protein